MTKIIDGKRYKTQTAEMIEKGGYGYRSDRDYYQESLYRTRKGKWVVAGGARSKYGELVDQNSGAPGDEIIVLTADEARVWCEQNSVDAEVIGRFFKVEDA